MAGESTIASVLGYTDDAFKSGRETGRGSLPPSLNPYPVLSSDHLRWHCGWIVGALRDRNVPPILTALVPTPIACVSCSCGGRGHCQDVA